MKASMSCWGAFASVFLAAPDSLAQVFQPLGAALSTASHESAVAAEDPMQRGTHAVAALNVPLLIGSPRWTLTRTTPPTNATAPAAFGSSPTAASRLAISFAGGSLVHAYTESGAGGRRLVISGLGGAPSPMTGPFGPPALSCVSTACLEVHATMNGGVAGFVFNATTRQAFQIRASSGAMDAPPAAAIVPVDGTSQRWFVAVSLPGAPRPIHVFRVDAPDIASSPTVSPGFHVFNAANADAPAITRVGSEVFVAARTGPQLMLAILPASVDSIIENLPVPESGLGVLSALASGPNGVLLAYRENVSGLQRPVARRLVRSGGWYVFPTIQTNILASEQATFVSLSSSATHPLLVFDVPGLLGLLESVRADYLSTECLSAADCGSARTRGGAACNARCLANVCDWSECFVVPDSGVPPMDTGVPPADTGVDTGVRVDSGATVDVPSSDIAIVDTGIDSPGIVPPADTGVAEDSSIVPEDVQSDRVELDARDAVATIDVAPNDSAMDVPTLDSAIADGAVPPGRVVRYGGGACECRATVARANGRSSPIAAWFAASIVLASFARRRRRSAA